MILVLGGTTEGRQSVTVLEEAGTPFFYSTRGDEQQVELHHGQRLTGAMDAQAMTDFCRQHDVRLLVDAAHPFATQLHQTVADTASALNLCVIRYERRYERPTGDGITWCASWDEAVDAILRDGARCVLALSGVQTIARLRPLWTAQGVETHVRILDRDASRKTAREAGFPEARLCYYHQDGDELPLMQRLMPDAILTKESGESGGFAAKVEAARQVGAQLYVVQRPPMPEGFVCVDGPHGLRRQVERLVPEFFPLHSGLTTGTCATAAAMGALDCLMGQASDEAMVRLPNGETIPVSLSQRQPAGATVVKDSGDDPDVTRGTDVCADIEFAPGAGYAVRIEGGEGVGRVTLPGLGLPVGEAAINAVPRRMMEENVTRRLHELHAPTGTYTLLISVPKGRELARRTFNPRMGVVDGISIIGTSGIVLPFSTEAFLLSIRRALEVALASGAGMVVINSGAKSEGFLKQRFPDVPAQAFVHYGNFIGETLRMAAALGIPRVVMGVMMGKAVKLAEGHLDTHSKKSVMNMDFILQVAREAGCRTATLQAIGGMTLARELWTLLPDGETEAVTRRLLALCHAHCDALLPQGRLDIVLIDEVGNVWPGNA